MAMATLSIDFEARLARLEQAFQKAAGDAEKSAKDIEKPFRDLDARMNSMFRGWARDITAALGAAAFVNLIKGAIDAQDHLNDLAKRSQLTVEQIGGIGFAASQAGSDVDGATLAMGKLSQTLAKAASGHKQEAALLKATGVSALDAAGNMRSVDDVLLELADKFASYKDGPNKAALANGYFGKSYASMLPLLNDGSQSLKDNIEFFQKYSGVTNETAKAADAFNDTMTKLHLLQQAFGHELANQLLPGLQKLADLWVENKTQGDKFHGTAEGLANIIKGAALAAAFGVQTFTGLGDVLGGVAAKMIALQHAADNKKSLLNPFGASAIFDIGPAFDKIDAETHARLEKSRSLLSGLQDAFYGPKSTAKAAAVFGDPGTSMTVKPSREAPGLPNTERTKHEKTQEIDRLIQKLQEQTIAEITAGDAMSHLEKAEFDLATNPKLANATLEKQKAFLALAKGLDLYHDKFADLLNTPRDNFNKSEARGMEATNEALRQSTNAQADAFHQLIAATPARQLEETRKTMQDLATAFEKGDIDVTTFTEAVQTKLGTLPESFAHVMTDMEQLAADGASGIQHALGDTVLDVLDGKFENIGKHFGDLLKKLIAQAIEADVGKYLLGDASKGGGFGGLITTIFPSLVGVGSKAGGGSVSPFSMTRVNEHGPEGLTVQGKDYVMNGGSWGKVTPAGGSAPASPTIVFNVAAGVTRNELATLLPVFKQQIKGELKNEAKRPGYAGV